jgi:hypothetical protein
MNAWNASISPIMRYCQLDVLGFAGVVMTSIGTYQEHSTKKAGNDTGAYANCSLGEPAHGTRKTRGYT